MPAPIKVLVINDELSLTEELNSNIAALVTSGAASEITLNDSQAILLQMLLELKKISLVLQSSTMTFLGDSDV